MTDSFNPSEIGGLPSDPVVVNNRGVLMRERESYERVIEGLKQASDGAHHLTMSKQDGNWRKLAALFDKLRAGAAQLGGLETALKDSAPSVVLHSSQHQGVHVAYARVYRGLDMAAKGARQVATCHRGDLRWSMYAAQLETLRDRCSQLIRMKQSQSPLILPAGFH